MAGDSLRAAIKERVFQEDDKTGDLTTEVEQDDTKGVPQAHRGKVA